LALPLLALVPALLVAILTAIAAHLRGEEWIFSAAWGLLAGSIVYGIVLTIGSVLVAPMV
jgi:hypothetical protein